MNNIFNDLAGFRQQFSALANKAYFNYGGQGPMPQLALEAIFKSYEKIQELGPFSAKTNSWIIEEQNQTKQAIASELGVTPATITLTEAVSVGCNIPLWGINWQPGEHLLITDCEHPGIIASVQELQRRWKIEISTCKLLPILNAGDRLSAITEKLQPNTRLVVLSHILWNTGELLPLAEIIQACRNYSPKIQILVDAAQSVGVLPLNLTEIDIDFYAFTGHKWWCGPEGLGGVYINPKALETLQPTFIGWRGINTDTSGNPIGWKPDGRKFEIATSAYPLLAGLRTAINYHKQWGTVGDRYQKICHLSKYLWQRLSELNQVKCLRTSPPESGLVSFQLTQQNHNKLVQFLETENIMVRTIYNPECVRACVHYFTLESEIDALVDNIKKFTENYI